MMTLAIAAFLASLVNKDVLPPRLAAVLATVAFIIIEIAFLPRPTPVLLSAPVLLLLLWASFVLMRRATLSRLPFAIVGVLVAVFATLALRGWLDAELLMRDPATQAKLRELENGIQSLSPTQRDAGLHE